MIPASAVEALLGADKTQPEITLANNYGVTGAPGSSYSGTVDIGAAANDRYVAICISLIAAGNTPVSSVTIGGVNCTKICGVDNTMLGDCCIWLSDTPLTSGTTATLNISMTSGSSYLMINVLRVVKLYSTSAISTGFQAAGTAAAIAFGTITVPAGATVIAFATHWPNTASSYTWSGTLANITELDDFSAPSGTAARASSAKARPAGATSGTLTATCTAAALSGRRGGCYAVIH